MRRWSLLLISVLLGSFVAMAGATPASAEPAGPAGSFTKTTRPATLHHSTTAYTITGAQYAVQQVQAGHQISTADLAQLTNAYCSTVTVSQWWANALGGTLYRVNGTMTWCWDGTNVWGGSYNWTTSTGFGWYFDHWSNPPNAYYVAAYEYHTVAQAKFCITWCLGSAYLGHDIRGNSDGTWDWHPI